MPLGAGMVETRAPLPVSPLALPASEPFTFHFVLSREGDYRNSNIDNRPGLELWPRAKPLSAFSSWELYPEVSRIKIFSQFLEFGHGVGGLIEATVLDSLEEGLGLGLGQDGRESGAVDGHELAQGARAIIAFDEGVGDDPFVGQLVG